jgi:hypothetical protein
MSGTPDLTTLRATDNTPGAIPSAWRASAATADIANMLDALETYKKKDPSKGKRCILYHVFCACEMRESLMVMTHAQWWFGSRLLGTHLS